MSGIQVIFGYPWVGVILFGSLIAYWSVVFVLRIKRGNPIASGEWIVYALGWGALALFISLVLRNTQ